MKSSSYGASGYTRNVDVGGFLDASRDKVCGFVKNAVNVYGDSESGENLEEKQFSVR